MNIDCTIEPIIVKLEHTVYQRTFDVREMATQIANFIVQNGLIAHHTEKRIDRDSFVTTYTLLIGKPKRELP